MSLERLEWDSNWFRLAIARADPGDPLAAARQADAEAVDCVYLLLPADADERLRAAQAAGFRVVDTRMELDKRLTGDERPPPRVRPLEPADVPRIEAICRKRFGGTRFTADPGFPADRVRELYVAWLDRARTSPERHVLVTDAADGFVICHEGEHDGSIELIAAADPGRGMGATLVAAADARLVGSGLERARVVTQARNLPALRLYSACGYRPCAAAYWLHRWRGAVSR